MKKERIISILHIVMDRLEDKSYATYASGICSHLSVLCLENIITNDEKLLLRIIIRDNKPDENQFTEFTQEKSWKGGIFWWTSISRDFSTAAIRVNFLKKLVEKITNGKK